MATFRLQCHPVVISFLCITAAIADKLLYADETQYLFKAANVTAEYLSTGMCLDQDLSLLLGLCGKIKPAFHCLAPAKHRHFNPCSKTVLSQSVAFTVPLQVQSHQLVDIETETNICDSTAGVGLTGEESNSTLSEWQR